MFCQVLGARLKTQQLDRSLLFHLDSAWAQLNYQLFQRKMKKPSFQLLDSENLLGSWHARDRVISIQREFICKNKWLEVLEVLKHEMAHQYVHEILKVFDETAHGPAFQEVCRERNIVAKSKGESSTDPKVMKLLSKIDKLLALAESDELHEAEQAAQQAHRLLVKHHIKLAQVEDYSKAFQKMSFCQLGEPKSRHYQYEYGIANLLNEHFFVSTIWVGAYSVTHSQAGNVLEICGRSEDLEIASYVYDFINHHLKFAWSKYKKETQAKGLKKRLSFSLGLVQGFAKKMQEGKQNFQTDEQGLIYLGQALTAQFLEGRYPHIRTRKTGGWSPSHDYHHGFEEGQTLRLRKGLKQEGSHGQQKKQLPLDPKM